MLHNVAKFTKGRNYITILYMTLIRPVLEQSAVVWHSSLSQENAENLETVQKSAMNLIMGNNKCDYSESLKLLNIQSLKERRKHLSLTLARQVLQNRKTRKMFPMSKRICEYRRRWTEKFQIKNQTPID